MVKRKHFHYSGVGWAGSIPGQGTKILHAGWLSFKKKKKKRANDGQPLLSTSSWQHLLNTGYLGPSHPTGT